jgi:transcriptional regulator with XRE-family HTH domain
MIIKDLIKSSGFKQKWIAEQLGVSEITISNWVSGKYIPSKRNREKLSKILGVSITEIG